MAEQANTIEVEQARGVPVMGGEEKMRARKAVLAGMAWGARAYYDDRRMHGTGACYPCRFYCVSENTGRIEINVRRSFMANVSRASATWEGTLVGGSGTVSAISSGVFSALPISWASRTQSHNGKTSPEELVASAHASCFAMALSHGLAQANTPAQRLEVDAAVTFGQASEGWRVVSSALTVRGTVPGLDAEGFRKAAEAAKEGCPISQMMKGNVELSVDATLAG